MNLTHNQVIKTSYETFLQRDRNTRKDEGLQFLFNLVFPIADRQQRATLEFCQYQIEDPECGFADSIEREMT